MITKMPENPCALCRSREATQLCDFVVEYAWFSKPGLDGRYTCDLPMCIECAKSQPGYDFCPYHKKMLGQLRNPDEKLQRLTIQHTSKMLIEGELIKDGKSK